MSTGELKTFINAYVPTSELLFYFLLHTVLLQFQEHVLLYFFNILHHVKQNKNYMHDVGKLTVLNFSAKCHCTG